MVLNELEIRILGVLIEKSLTQAGSYPLTLNAITLGANQLQNRDPVMAVSDHDISAALRTLQHKKLALQAPPSPGARSNRFQHNVVETLHWDRRDQAIMAELMLRGRQTAGELRSRAARMTPFQDVQSVMVTLQGLKSRQPSWVEELPREPGRSANRWRHLLAPLEDRAESPTHVEEISAPEEVEAASQPPDDLREAVAALADRVARLEGKVDSLRRVVDEFKRTPESHMG